MARGGPIAQARQLAPGPLLTSDQRPEVVIRIASFTPRMAIMRETLVAAGLPVVDVVFGREHESPDPAPMLWLALKVADGTVRWASNDTSQ